jgi:hypothetical protein
MLGTAKKPELYTPHTLSKIQALALNPNLGLLTFGRGTFATDQLPIPEPAA